MKARLLLIAALVLLSGCDGEPRQTIGNTPAEYVNLTPAAQVCLALEFPLVVAAIGFALHGFTLFKYKRVTKPEAKE